MPRVEIPGVGIVKFPDDMSRDEIMSRAETMQLEAQKPILDPRDLPAGELIKGGFARGIEGLKGTAFDLIPALAGSMFGADKYAKEQMQEYADRMAAVEAEHPTAYKSYRDIAGAGDVVPFAVETIGEIGPDILSFLTGAGVGTVGGKYVAKKGLQSAVAAEAAEIAAKKGLTKTAEKEYSERLFNRAMQAQIGKEAAERGARIGTQTGLFGASMGLNVPDVLQSVYEDTGDLRPGIALTMGPIIGLLDAYLPAKILQQLGPSGKSRIAAELLEKSKVVPTTWKKAFGAELLKTTGGEALTEGTQQALQIAASQIAGDKKKFFSQENIDEIITASLKGMVGGATYGAPGAAVEAKRIKSERQNIIDQEAARKAAVQDLQKRMVETPRLGYTPETPVVFPDGYVATNQQEADAYRQKLFDQGYAPQDLQGQTLDMFGNELVFEQQRLAEQARRERLGEEAPPAEEVLPQEIPGFSTKLDEGTLSKTGLSKSSGYYKKLLNKDMADPVDQEAVKTVLAEVRANPRLSNSTKQAIETVALQAFGALAKQQEMFGPRGGVLKGAAYGRAKPRTVTEPVGAGVSVPSGEMRAEPGPTAEGVTPPESEGMGVAAEPAAQPRVRKTAQRGALSPEEEAIVQQELQDELSAAATTPPTPAPTAPTPTAQAAQAQAVPPTPTTVAPAAPAPATPTAAAPAAAPMVAPTTQPPLAPAPAPRGKRRGAKEKSRLEPVAQRMSEFVGGGYLSFAPQDVVDQSDRDNVQILMLGGLPATPENKAAQTYFSKMERLVDGLINIAFDIAFNTPRFRMEGETTAEADFFRGMNGEEARKARDWVLANLSPQTQEQFRNFVRGFERARDAYTDAEFARMLATSMVGKAETELDETVRDYLRGAEEDRARAKNRAERRMAEGKTRKQYLQEDALTKLNFPLHPAIVGALMNGDLVSALRLMAASSDPFVSRMAKRLADVNLTTKVVVQQNLTNEAGDAVPGFYDPATDTIYIDAVTGMNNHVLLHEPGHAATSHVLDNPSHPVTKQLQNLFDKIKDSLGTAYGSTSLQEFVAEAQSNPEFKETLQTINPDGGKMNAWDKFVRIVSNFFRRLVGMETKPLESAFDRADRLIEAILSPAPESRDAGVLYAAANAGTASKIFDKMGNLIESIPGVTPDRANRIHEFVKNTLGGNFRNFMLSALPLNALADVANQAGLKMAPTVDKLVNERSGFEYSMNQGIEPLVQRAEAFAKSESQAQVDLFNDVVYSSTLAKVDPTKPRSAYKTPEQLKDYDEISAKFTRLGGRGRALYSSMRDAYKKMYEEILNSIYQRVDASVPDKARAEIIKKDIYAKLVEKGSIDPYFPLTRYGKYWLSFNERDASGQIERYVEAFETERERSQRIAQLQGSGATDIQQFSNLSELNYRSTPTNSFVNSILKILEINQVPEATTEEVMRLFLSTLPETSFAQSFQRRKETPGFNKDAIRALREKMYRTSHQIANMRYAARLNAVLQEMKDYARTIGRGSDDEAQRDNRVINEYVKEFEKRINYINNPNVARWSQVATSFGFGMTLGFNVSSAVINLSQVPLILMPYLGGKYGYGETMRAIQDAYRVYSNSGFKTDVEVFGSEIKDADGNVIRPAERVVQKAMPALDNFNFDDPNLPPAIRRLRTLARVATEQGQLNRSQLYDILQVDERNSAMSKINAASGFIFHHAERMNRQVSLIAAYNLELNRIQNPNAKLQDGRKAGELSQQQKEEYAANQAIYTAELTNGGISAASAPRIAQSSLGKVLFMFKRYGVSMYYLLFKTAREALKNEDPDVRKAAMRQIAGIYGTAALFAGIQGIPLFGIAAMVYNAFAGDDEDDLETATRKTLGEFFYKGLLNHVTNTEIASRTGLNDLIIRDSGKQDSQSFALSMMEMMGGPVYGVASKVERGISMINEGNVQRGIENILPTSIGNIMKSIRYATEGTRTLRGDPITGEVNGWNVGAQFFGFAPADYTKQLEINAREKGIDKRVNQDASKIKRQYYIAKRVGDIDAMNEARAELLELGKRYPGLEINEGTLFDVLDRSMAAQERATKEMVHGVRYSKRMRDELLRDAAELAD